MKRLSRGYSIIEMLVVLAMVTAVGAILYATLRPLLASTFAMRESWNAELHLHRLEFQLRNDSLLAEHASVQAGSLVWQLRNGHSIQYVPQGNVIRREWKQQEVVVKSDLYTLGEGVLWRAHWQTPEQQKTLGLTQPLLILELRREPHDPAKLAAMGLPTESQHWLEFQLLANKLAQAEQQP